MKDHSRLSKKRIFSNVGSRQRSSHATLSFTKECKNIWEDPWQSYFNILSCFCLNCVWYIRTFLSQSPRSLTHSCDRNPILSIESMKLEHGLCPSDARMYAEAYIRSSICTQKHICTHTYFPWRNFCIYEERSGFHKQSRTAPTYNLLQPKYSQTLMLSE